MNRSASTTPSTTESAGESDDPDASASEADNPPERPKRQDTGAKPAPAAPPADVDVRLASPDPGDASDLPHVDARWVRDRLFKALGRIDRPVDRVTVNIVDDATMRALNERHRKAAGTTDVLAFDLSAPGEPLEADIVICADEAARRAAERRYPIERELLLYALHGVLHCAGFDDQTNEDFEAMHAEEDRILTAIGVGPTFSSGHDDGRSDAAVTEDDRVV